MNPICCKLHTDLVDDMSNDGNLCNIIKNECLLLFVANSQQHFNMSCPGGLLQQQVGKRCVNQWFVGA